MSELKRFEALFEQLVEQTFVYLERIEVVAAYGAVPVDSDVNFLGQRVNKITIGALLRHYIVAEAHWFQHLAEAKDDAVIPFPRNAALLDGVEDGMPLLQAYREIVQQARQQLGALAESDLDRSISFAGRHYSVMGMLWTILGHHSFHLGQIDLLMRQQNIEPPEYMEWPETKRVIA